MFVHFRIPGGFSIQFILLFDNFSDLLVPNSFLFHLSPISKYSMAQFLESFWIEGLLIFLYIYIYLYSYMELNWFNQRQCYVLLICKKYRWTCVLLSSLYLATSLIVLALWNLWNKERVPIVHSGKCMGYKSFFCQ